MKRILVLLLAIIFMFSTPVFAEVEENSPISLALVDVDTGAQGSSVNYFVLRPLMEYDNREGIAEGKMFGGIVFSLKYAPLSASAAEGFISTLLKKGTCIPAADDVAGEMKEDGFLAKDGKYPIYAAIPCVFSLFDSDAERRGFCEYYIDTLVGVFQGAELKNTELKGFYFSSDYDACPDLRSYCIAIAKEKGLSAIASSTVGNIDDAMVFAANEKVKDQLSLKTKVNGYTLHLDGVPNDNFTAPYDKLSSQYNELVKEKAEKSNLLVSFKAFNDVYDCASAIEDTVPNENARKTYELLKGITDGSLKDTTVDKKDESNHSIIIAASCLVVAVIGALAYILYRKGKKNDCKQRK